LYELDRTATPAYLIRIPLLCTNIWFLAFRLSLKRLAISKWLAVNEFCEWACSRNFSGTFASHMNSWDPRLHCLWTWEYWYIKHLGNPFENLIESGRCCPHPVQMLTALEWRYRPVRFTNPSLLQRRVIPGWEFWEMLAAICLPWPEWCHKTCHFLRYKWCLCLRSRLLYLASRQRKSSWT